jgi:hypothetical protein
MPKTTQKPATLAEALDLIASPEVKQYALEASRAAIVECMTKLAGEDMPALKKATRLECFGEIYEVLNGAMAPSIQFTTKAKPRYGPPPLQ